MSRFVEIVALLGVVVLAAGCEVGPDRRQGPPVEMPDVFASADGEGAPIDEWWRAFADPVLDRLVQRALANNRDLDVALARVAEARAAAGIADAAYLPQIGFAAERQWLYASREAVGLAGAGVRSGLIDRKQDVHRVGLDASWELDLFGALSRRVEVADARAEAAEAGVHGVALRVTAEVVSAYVDLRFSERELELIEARLASLEGSLALARARVKSGLADASAVRAATVALAAERAAPAQWRADVLTATWRLAVLCGAMPSSFEVPDSDAALRVPVDLPLGVPSDLLRRRPDVRVAEAELAETTAEVGVRTTDLYPRVFLFAAGGLESISLDRLFRSDAAQGSFGPSLQVPLFRGGQLRQALEAAEMREQAALAAFAQQVLQAVADVETASRRHRANSEQRDTIGEADREAARLLRLAEVRRTAGLTDREDLLLAERFRIDAALQLLAAERALAASAIGTCKALGGGFEGRASATTEP